MKKTIFLDFDGVLHGEGINSKGFFEHMDLFCNTIRPFSNIVNIVISSSWREGRSLSDIQDFFAEDLQHLVVGVTPIITEGYEPGGRQKEILMYCEKNNIDNDSWIALDDMAHLFEENCKNLILINPETGLFDGDIKLLTYYLTNNQPKQIKLK